MTSAPMNMVVLDTPGCRARRTGGGGGGEYGRGGWVLPQDTHQITIGNAVRKVESMRPRGEKGSKSSTTHSRMRDATQFGMHFHRDIRAILIQTSVVLDFRTLETLRDHRLDQVQG